MKKHNVTLQVHASCRLFSLGGAIAVFILSCPWALGVDAIQLEYGMYRVGEAAGLVSVAVIRGPDADQAATVDFTTATISAPRARITLKLKAR